ncbi:hypothetical protein CHISP_2663 [Chitinispirillum alkaliphilum]|nr:hypothetical protein CHISP_2663 [Chitinispirillum alkaliphilum]
MKMLTIVFIIASVVFAQTERYTTEHFITKHDLQIPIIEEKDIDISQHTHKSDSWFYFYVGETDKIDSVYRFINIERFPPNESFINMFILGIL